MCEIDSCAPGVSSIGTYHPARGGEGRGRRWGGGGGRGLMFCFGWTATLTVSSLLSLLSFPLPPFAEVLISQDVKREVEEERR